MGVGWGGGVGGYIACWSSMFEMTMIETLDKIKFARTAYFVKNHALGIAGPTELVAPIS